MRKSALTPFVFLALVAQLAGCLYPPPAIGAWTVADNYRPLRYTASSGQTSFSVTWVFESKSDLRVQVSADDGATWTSKTVDTDFTVTGAGVSGGGTVAFVAGHCDTSPTGCTADTLVVIYRDDGIDRTVDFTTLTPTGVDTHMDRQTVQLQQIEDIAQNRALQVPVGNDYSGSGFSPVLPGIDAADAGLGVALEDDLSGFEYVDFGDVDGPASSTDNAVPRFDGTTGKQLQNSAVIISDANAVSGVSALTVSGSGTFGGTVAVAGTVAATTVTGANVTSGADPGHTHSGAAITDGSIGAADLGVDSVGSSEIAADAVGSSEIAADAVGTSEIAADGVAASEIAADAVGASEIAANAVGSSEIADGGVATADIALGAVTASKMAIGSVTNDAILDGTIQSADFAALAVDNAALGTGAVESDNIQAGAVTQAKIATGAVDSDQLAANSVELSEITSLCEGTGNEIVQFASNGTPTCITAGGDVAGAFNNLQLAAGSVGLSEVTSLCDGTSNQVVQFASNGTPTCTIAGGDVVGSYGALSLAADSVGLNELAACTGTPNQVVVYSGAGVPSCAVASGTGDVVSTGVLGGQVINGGTVGGVNEVQTVTVDATSGNFTLTYAGQTTANIAYNAGAATVVSRLEALSNIDNVDATGTLAGGMAVSFTGTLRETNVATMTATDVTLAGGGDTVTVTPTTAGVDGDDLALLPNAVSLGQVTIGTGVVYDEFYQTLLVGKTARSTTGDELGILEVDTTSDATALPKTAARFSSRTSGIAGIGYGVQLALLGESAAGTERTMGRLVWEWEDATDGSEDAGFTLEVRSAGANVDGLSVSSTGLLAPAGGVSIPSDKELTLGGTGGSACKYDSGADLVQCLVDSGASLEVRSNSYAGDLIASFTAESSSTENFAAYYNGAMRFESCPAGLCVYGSTPITFDDGGFNSCDTLGTSTGNLTCNGGFDGSATINPASMNTAASTTVAFTCTGGILGDIVSVGPGVDMEGIVFSASVTSTNNCEVALVNLTGGTLDLASSTWKYTVRR